MVESNIVRLTHNGVSGFDYHGIIQGHLDLGKIVILESGTTWEISQPLWLRRGSGLKAEGVADRYPVTTEVAPAGYPINATVIKLVTISGAPALTNSAVIMISPLNIGVASSNIDPNDSSKYLAPATSDNVFAASLEGLVIDGNNIADYGVYAYRAHDMSIENCVFTHTQKHAVYVTACYSGYISHCLAFDNDGCGFTFGFGDLDFPNLPKWPVTGAQLNGFVVDDIHAVACGLARTFDDGIISTNPPKWRDGCGIALRPHRGNVFTKLTSENNDGANLYLEPTGQSNIINGYYSELANSHFVPAGPGGQPPKIKSAIEDERAAVLWDIVVNLDSENDNVFRAFGNRFENALCGGGWIRILGDIPPVPGRQGQAMCFANFSGGLGTYADNDLYYFENSEPKYTTEFLPHTSISSEDAKAPNGIRGSYNGNVLADAGVVAHANFKYDEITDTFTNIDTGATAGGAAPDWGIDINRGNVKKVVRWGTKSHKAFGLVLNKGTINENSVVIGNAELSTAGTSQDAEVALTVHKVPPFETGRVFFKFFKTSDHTPAWPDKDTVISVKVIN